MSGQTRQPFDVDVEFAAPPGPRGRPRFWGTAPFLAGALVGAVCVAPLAFGLNRTRSLLFAPAVPVTAVGRLPRRDARAGLATPYRAAVGAALKVKVGDTFPDIALDRDDPPGKLGLLGRMRGQRVILVGLPCDVAPASTSAQVSGYLAKQAELNAKRVADVLVYCAHDHGAILEVWASTRVSWSPNLVTVLGDRRRELTKALGLTPSRGRLSALLGGARRKRFKSFSMYIDDGVIKTFNVDEAEDDTAGGADPMITFMERALGDIPDPA